MFDADIIAHIKQYDWAKKHSWSWFNCWKSITNDAKNKISDDLVTT